MGFLKWQSGCIVAQELAYFLCKSRALWATHTVVAAQLCSDKTSFIEGLDLANPCCDHRLIDSWDWKETFFLMYHIIHLVLTVICGILTRFLSEMLENMGTEDTFMIK